MRLEEILMEGRTSDLRELMRSPIPDLHPLQSQSIDARWREWLPWVAIEARKTADPAQELSRLKSCHRSRTINLLNAGVTWKQIRNRRLDDPMVGENLFTFALRAAIERHRMMKANVARRKKPPVSSKNPSMRKMKEMRIP